MRSIIRYLGLATFILSTTTSIYALPYPITTPTGEITGGTYRMYFDNIFSSETLCDGAHMVVGGFNNIGQPICVTPVSTGLYITGQTLGDTLRFDGVEWVRNNLIYNDGTAIGIADQTPSYLLDVGGTANFLGIRFPTGAASGYVLTSDASGLAHWSDAPNISLSGVTGGSQYVVPKFGLGGTGLILSSIYDDGVTVGINTLVPNASYKLDIVGGDARINGVRYGVGGGNLSSNVAIGLSAFGANVTSPNNVVIGNLAGTTLTAGAGGNILIGSSVNTTSATASNELNIGNWIFGSGGNIGIGTGVGINTRLKVDGQIQITGGSPAAGSYLQSDANGVAIWTGVTASMITATGITGGTEYYLTKFGAGGNGLYASVLYESGSKLGLNTMNPSVELDVNGTIRVRSGAALGYVLTSDVNGVASWQTPGVSMNTWNILGNAGTTAGTHFLGTTDAQDLVFKSNSIEYMRILTTGRVGIGTSAPGQKLTVSGGTLQLINGSQANGRMLISDATGIASWTGVIIATDLNLAGAVTGSTLFYRSGAWNVGTGIYNAGGNIGIGTATPGAALEVAGQVKITGGTPGAGKILVSDATGLASWQNTSATLSGTYWSLSGNTAGANDFFGTLNAQNLRFYSSGAQRMVLDTTGNLGIGSTAPGQKLTVSGGTLQLINGSQANGRMLISDANGIASWTGVIIATDLNLAGAVTGSTLFYRSGAWNVGTGIYNAGGNIGIGTATPGSALEIAGQVKITGGSPGLNEVLTSDATGLASWTPAISSLSGSFWTLSGNAIGANDFIGSTNGQDLRFYTNATQKMVLDTNGNLGIGIASAGANKLYVNGDTYISGALSVLGKLYVDSIVSRTVTNVTVSGSLLPDAAAPIIYRDLGSNTQRWNNAYLTGQITIGGGSPGLGKMLISDATGLASWTGVITATNLNLAGAVTGSTIYFNSGAWRVGTGMFNNGTRVGIGTANPTKALTINSGLSNDSGLRISQLISTSPVFTGVAAPLGVDGSGNVVVAQQGAIPVYTALGATPNAAADSTTNPPTIGANYDRYFTINARQAFTVTDVGGNPYNCPEFQTGSTNKGPTGCTQTPWATYVMTAQNATSGNRYAYQILISDRTDAPFVVRGGMYSSGCGTLMNTAMTIPALWFKAITVPTNRSDWFYINPGVDQNNNVISGGGNVGIGTMSPTANLDVVGTVRLRNGTPGLGKILVSDATGNASWTGAVTATSLSIPGSETGATLFYTGGAWYAGTGLYNAGGNIAIGTTPASTSKLIINSGLTGTAGLRFSQINSSSTVVSTNVVGLGVDAGGNVVPISNGDVIVYDGLSTSTPSPDPNVATRQISYDFNKFFDIPARQSFVVSDGSNPGQNAPYIDVNASSSICEWTGKYGTGIATCPTTDAPGSPYNSFTMSARGLGGIGYQLGIAYRGDVPLMARAGYFRGGYGSGLYLGAASSTPAPWFKVFTVPTNHIEYFYIDTGFTGRFANTGRAGNVAVGTTTPDSKFEVWNTNGGTSLLHFRGSNNIGIGSGTVRTALSGNANSGFGHESLYTLTSGYSNTAIGYKSQRLTTTGFNNAALGQETLYNNAGGSWNSALGYQAGYSNTSGTGNIAIGPLSVYYNTVGANNIGIGYYALRGTTGNSTSNNIGIGLNTLSGATGNNNIAIGGLAGDEIRAGANNILLGYDAQVSNPNGSNQLSIGNWIYGSGGNIGIGTTNSTAKLEVAGQIKITGGSPGAGKVLTSDATGLATWQTSGGGGGGTAGWGFSGDTIGANDYIGTNNTQGLKFATNGVQRMLLDTSGNLGIGTSTGTSKLEVAGTVKLGSNGTQITSMGVCTTASITITNTASVQTCTGLPASSSIAIHCSPNGAFSTPNTTTLFCRPNNVINQMVCNTSAANTNARIYKCMWMQ